MTYREDAWDENEDNLSVNAKEKRQRTVVYREKKLKGYNKRFDNPTNMLQAMQAKDGKKKGGAFGQQQEILALTAFPVPGLKHYEEIEDFIDGVEY